MAVTLTIDGTTYEVIEDGAEEGDPEVIGTRRRAFDGTPRSSEQQEFRVFSFQLWRLTEAEYMILRSKFDLGRTFPVVSELTGNMTMWGKVVRAGYIHENTSYRRGVTIQLIQAVP